MTFLHKASVLVLFIFIDNVYGYTCEEETIFGITVSKSCPGPFDSADAIYCCGPKDDKKCCNYILGGIKEEDLEKIAEYIPTLIGIIVSVVLGLIACGLICCCCPFCLIHKRRHRGVIHQPAVERTNPVPQQGQTTSYAAVQPASYPTQPAPYPMQPTGYPSQPTPYPTQPTGYPAHTSAPYPTQSQAPGFVSPALNTSIQMQAFAGDQPPPYTEKQQAYNPNF